MLARLFTTSSLLILSVTLVHAHGGPVNTGGPKRLIERHKSEQDIRENPHQAPTRDGASPSDGAALGDSTGPSQIQSPGVDQVLQSAIEAAQKSDDPALLLANISEALYGKGHTITTANIEALREASPEAFQGLQMMMKDVQSVLNKYKIESYELSVEDSIVQSDGASYAAVKGMKLTMADGQTIDFRILSNGQIFFANRLQSQESMLNKIFTGAMADSSFGPELLAILEAENMSLDEFIDKCLI